MVFSLLFISWPHKLLFLCENFPYLLASTFLPVSLFVTACVMLLSPSEQQQSRVTEESNVDFPASWQLLQKFPMKKFELCGHSAFGFLESMLFFFLLLRSGL